MTVHVDLHHFYGLQAGGEDDAAVVGVLRTSVVAYLYRRGYVLHAAIDGRSYRSAENIRPARSLVWLLGNLGRILRVECNSSNRRVSSPREVFDTKRTYRLLPKEPGTLHLSQSTRFRRAGKNSSRSRRRTKPHRASRTWYLLCRRRIHLMNARQVLCGMECKMYKEDGGTHIANECSDSHLRLGIFGAQRLYPLNEANFRPSAPRPASLGVR